MDLTRFSSLLVGVVLFLSACSAAHDVETERPLSVIAASQTSQRSAGVWSWQVQTANGVVFVAARDKSEDPIAELTIEIPTQSGADVNIQREWPKRAHASVRHDGTVVESSSAELTRELKALLSDVRSSTAVVSGVGLTTSALRDPDAPDPRADRAECMADCRDSCGPNCDCAARCAPPKPPGGGSTGGGAPPMSPSTGLPIYGNYCGPAYGDPTYQVPPIDAVDAACQAHDRCYDSTNYFNCGCDRALIGGMPAAKAAANSSTASTVADAIVAYFSGSPCVCQSWVCFLVPSSCTGVGGAGLFLAC